MKKTAAIFLLSIFLFNWFGYRILTSYLEDKASIFLESALDNNNYDETDLISIKVAATLPYYNNSPQYERVDGEIQINGVHYNYVKRRLYNDSLEYVCIRNAEKSRINNASTDFFKMVNDIQHPGKKPAAGTSSKNFLGEYYQENNSWTFNSYSPARETITAFYNAVLPHIALSPKEQPPDLTGFQAPSHYFTVAA